MKYKLAKGLGLCGFIRLPLVEKLLPAANFVLGLPFVFCGGRSVTVNRISLPSKAGGSFKALIFSPKERRTSWDRTILFLHGGGFIYRAAPHHYTLARKLAVMAEADVIFPDYRTSPKYKYPIPFMDCLSAYEYALSLGSVPAIYGDSAGGALALAVALAAAKGGRAPECLLISYPVTDCEMNTESMRRFTDTPMWNAVNNAKMWQCYLENGVADEFASPAKAKSYAGLPRTYIETAEFDCLRDEGLALYAALQRDGVAVTLNETKQTPHGYDLMRNSRIVKVLDARRLDFLTRKR